MLDNDKNKKEPSNINDTATNLTKENVNETKKKKTNKTRT